MLTTNEAALVDSLTAFGTDMDYALDDDGLLAYEYNLPLGQVLSALKANDEAMALYYESLGYERNAE